MADHAKVEYATADGNEYVEHEATYRRFVRLTTIVIIHVINILLGLLIGGVLGHWRTAAVVFVLTLAAAIRDLVAASKTWSLVVLGLALVAFALSAAT